MSWSSFVSILRNASQIVHVVQWNKENKSSTRVPQWKQSRGGGGKEAVLPNITHRYVPPQRVWFWCRFGLKTGMVQWLENRSTSFITRFRHNLYWLLGCLFNLLISECSKFLLNGRMTHKNGSFHSHNISLLKKSWTLFFYTTVCLSGLVILLRGDRPHIFTGVKPLKTFFVLLHWEELFQGSYSLKSERWYSFYIPDQDAAR